MRKYGLFNCHIKRIHVSARAKEYIHITSACCLCMLVTSDKPQAFSPKYDLTFWLGVPGRVRLIPALRKSRNFRRVYYSRPFVTCVYVCWQFVHIYVLLELSGITCWFQFPK